MDRVRVAAVLAAVSAFSGCATSGSRHSRPIPTSALAGPRGIAVMQHGTKGAGQPWLTVGGGQTGGRAARGSGAGAAPAALTNRAPAGADQYFPMLAGRGPTGPASNAPELAVAERRPSRPSAFAERERVERFAVARAQNASRTVVARRSPEPDDGGVLPVALSAELPPRDDNSRLASVDLREDGTPVEPVADRPPQARKAKRKAANPIPPIAASLAEAPAPTVAAAGPRADIFQAKRSASLRMQSPDHQGMPYPTAKTADLGRGAPRPFAMLRQFSKKLGEKITAFFRSPPKLFNRARQQAMPGALTPIQPPSVAGDPEMRSLPR